MDVDWNTHPQMKSRGNRLRYLKLRDSNRRCTSPEGDGYHSLRPYATSLKKAVGNLCRSGIQTHNWTKVFAGHTQDPPVSLEKVYKKSVCFALGSAKRPSLNREIHVKINSERRTQWDGIIKNTRRTCTSKHMTV